LHGKATEVSAPVSVSKARAESASELTPLPAGLTGSTPSWVISLVGHLLVLACLWPIHMATSMFRETIVSGSVEDEEAVAPLQQDSLRFDSAVVEEIGTRGDSASDAGDRVAPLGPAIETPRAPVLNVVGTATALGTKQMAIKRPMLDVGSATPDRELSDVVETTGSSEHAGGIRGAVDWLTNEIDSSLRQENTLVIWLFDATPSMKERREAIAERFDNVYRQLGILGAANHGALKTAVATFGRSVEFLTRKPVDDIASVQQAIHKIKDDGDPDKDSVENVFGACLNVAERYRSFRTGTKDRRRVMIIAVTDERGSDFGRVEEAIVKLRKLGMRVYCVGDDAVFGREKHFFPHVFQDGFHGLGYTLRGPETARLESVQLPFWGRGGYGEITSGFGPYALCRLCSETGGVFLISDEMPGPTFDPAILRNYIPDYRPLREYEAERGRNAAKAALVEAAVMSAQDGSAIEKIPQPRMQFRADNDNTFRREITEAQKPLAELDYRLTQIHTLLEGGEKSRTQLDTPRWRATFDLAMGRVLALRARALGYNVMLADMKILPRQFQTPGDNTWRIVPASEEHAPPRSQKFAKRAREYLEGVIQEHHGTQWELLAREELKAPMAWDWQELHVDYPPPAPPRPPRNGIQLEEDRQREMMRRQQQEEHVPVKQ
jgi:hypothetical protein